MALMEGTLWKWTNYLSGWQPRYFVLEVGVLSYYKSQEEVGLGSRGSIKMSCCEISVHPTDTVRIDLRIPPEQYIYLRAATPAERQQWVVAMGTAKACITQCPSPNDKKPLQTSKTSQLKEKMEELSMYRSLLLQQISTIKLMCTEKDDNQEFNEAATMLSATCDEFLKNLCDCMEIADNSFLGSPPGSPTPQSSEHAALRKHLLRDSHRTPPLSPTSSVASSSVGSSASASSSGEKASPSRPSPPRHSMQAPAPRNTESRTPRTTNVATGKPRIPTPSSSASRDGASEPAKTSDLISTPRHAEPEQPKEPDHITFFSSTQHKFEDVIVTPDGGIPTKSFLAACTCILPFFDVMGSTAFAPVKMDIGGNIRKISSKFDTDPKAFYTLQNIVYQELKSNTCTAKNSATDALLWLKRALEFMQIFLAEVVKGRQDLAVAAGIAYEKTLRKYHGWVVRGVFALAVKAVPYREDFLTTLGTTETGLAPSHVVLSDMKSCVTALGALTQNLNLFYISNKLDSDLTV
ncbi:pleckstrin homology domain-containing family A member 8 isoform X2 [Nematostella vectensis]|uniref:pleckstrin homology domain-containing family A member 8 isoform X2 n=1 Tax=Nematostella vectensis TaxID=45351 RepID=UPI002077559C|nr:pleckstrin homology domain-containing family A member 8 isoform X2 [Nematostella vectensis]